MDPELAALVLALLAGRCGAATGDAPTSSAAAPLRAATPDAAQESATPEQAAVAFDHSDYDALLKKHVRGDRVDYAALKADRAALDAYCERLAKLPAADFAKLSRDEQMALWTNAYNALTLRSIVDAYPIQAPTIKLNPHPRNSIRQIDDVWNKQHKVASREVSLDDVEHEILRKQWKDPRIHAAVNCASKGCPALRAEAFVAARLDEQLDDQMRRFVADSTRNQIDPKGKKIRLSSIFKWFGEDFGTKQDERALLRWLAKFGPSDWKPLLDSFDPDDVDFLDYDWSLNDVDR
jgi:hypothetical protein